MLVRGIEKTGRSINVLKAVYPEGGGRRVRGKKEKKGTVVLSRKAGTQGLEHRKVKTKTPCTVGKELGREWSPEPGTGRKGGLVKLNLSVWL